MDEVERLIQAFRARAKWSVLSKLDALLDLEQLDDPRIVSFLVHVLADQRERTEVRIHVLKQLRNGRLQRTQRRSVARAILQVVSDRSSPELRLQAVLALVVGGRGARSVRPKCLVVGYRMPAPEDGDVGPNPPASLHNPSGAERTRPPRHGVHRWRR